MPITTADLLTLTNRFEELGLLIPRDRLTDQYTIGFALDTPSSNEYRYNFKAIVGDGGVTVTHHIGDKIYTASITVEQFMKLDKQRIEHLVTLSRTTNEAYDEVQNQLKSLLKSHRATVAANLKLDIANN